MITNAATIPSAPPSTARTPILMATGGTDSGNIDQAYRLADADGNGELSKEEKKAAREKAKAARIKEREAKKSSQTPESSN